MTNEALARRWMASKHWGGWRVGMVDYQWRVCVMAEDEFWFHCGLNHTAVVQPGSPWIGNRVPDLDHPGTRAFLLEDVRRSWGPESYVDTFALFGGASCIRVLAPNRPSFKTPDHDTEAEALIAALEAAPE